MGFRIITNGGFMNKKFVGAVVIALLGNFAQALTLQTVDGKSVEVSSGAVLQALDSAVKENGRIIYDAQEILPNGHVVFSNPRYLFNDKEYVIFGASGWSSACALLGFENFVWHGSRYSNSEMVYSHDKYAQSPQVRLISGGSGSVIETLPQALGHSRLTALECYRPKKN
jgi:hypothetical protein